MDNVISLDDLFHKRLFRVPDYQRGYSWEKQQVQEFLEDLDTLPSNRHHYTGTVVLCATRSEGEQWDIDGNAYSQVDIVDGQQRLTTITLLLDGIRRSLADLSSPSQALAKGISKNFIAAEAINEQPLYKLSLNADANRFFRSNILAETPSVEGPRITSERRLVAAKKQITDHLTTSAAGLGTSAAEQWLVDLYKKVANQLWFTLYELDDESEVGVIFETMNDRGKPLTDLEKVKNLLLHTSTRLSVANNLDQTVKEAWGEILRQMMAANLVRGLDEDQLLAVHWFIHYNPRRKQWERSKSVKNTFDVRQYRDNHKELLQQLEQYTSGLRETCVSFCDAYMPTRDNAFASFSKYPKERHEVVEWSEKLRRIRVIATFLPALIAVRERWPEDPQKYLEVLKLCEAFAFRVFRLRGYRADTGQAAFARLGYDLATNKHSFQYCVRFIKAELLRRCSDDQFADEINADSPDDWYSWVGLRYLLYEYEVELGRRLGASPRVNWGELSNRDLQDTIEHILPQSIDKQRYWTKRFRKPKHTQYVHDLGNLTLTKHNSSYQNKSFPDKKGDANCKNPCYAKSPLFIENDLTRWDDWDADAIDQRRAEILNWAQSRWAVDWGNQSGEYPQQPLVEDETDEDIGDDEG